MWQEAGYIFATPTGTPLDGTNVTKQFKRLLAESGLEPMRFHDLRHSSASLLLAQGVEMRLVMEALGHSQISLTANTYTHVIPSLRQEVARQMHGVLAGT